MRKDNGYEVTDTIEIKIEKDSAVEAAVLQNENYIKNETLATSLDLEDKLEDGILVEFDDVATKLHISKN